MTPPDSPAGNLAGYRQCAGVMLFNPAGLVFVGQRLDTPDAAWQMPQGGIDGGEAPIDAAKRELAEETGITSITLLAEHPDWLTYDLPADLAGELWRGKYLGQVQKWFAMRFTGDETEIDLAAHTPEFSAWQWVEIAHLPELIVPFKRDLYQRLATDFAALAMPLAHPKPRSP